MKMRVTNEVILQVLSPVFVQFFKLDARNPPGRFAESDTSFSGLRVGKYVPQQVVAACLVRTRPSDLDDVLIVPLMIVG